NPGSTDVRRLDQQIVPEDGMNSVAAGGLANSLAEIVVVGVVGDGRHLSETVAQGGHGPAQVDTYTVLHGIGSPILDHVAGIAVVEPVAVTEISLVQIGRSVSRQTGYDLMLVGCAVQTETVLHGHLRVEQEAVTGGPGIAAVEDDSAAAKDLA